LFIFFVELADIFLGTYNITAPC